MFSVKLTFFSDFLAFVLRLINCIYYFLFADKKFSKENRPRIKCVLVGDGHVGKTNLIRTYLENRFVSDYIPTASDIYNGKYRCIYISFFCQIKIFMNHGTTNFKGAEVFSIKWKFYRKIFKHYRLRTNYLVVITRMVLVYDFTST